MEGNNGADAQKCINPACERFAKIGYKTCSQECSMRVDSNELCVNCGLVLVPGFRIDKTCSPACAGEEMPRLHAILSIRRRAGIHLNGKYDKLTLAYKDICEKNDALKDELRDYRRKEGRLADDHNRLSRTLSQQVEKYNQLAGEHDQLVKKYARTLDDTDYYRGELELANAEIDKLKLQQRKDKSQQRKDKSQSRGAKRDRAHDRDRREDDLEDDLDRRDERRYHSDTKQSYKQYRYPSN